MMKTIITVILLSASILSQAQTPNWNEWFKQKKTQRKYLVRQIAALQVYLEYLKTGYKIVDKGLTTIGQIKDGTFGMDKDYFHSLKQVNPLIRKSPKINQALVMQQSILHDFQTLIAFCKKDGHYLPTEIQYVVSVYNGMLRQGQHSVDELTIITTSGDAEMKDDERLDRLDKVHGDLEDQLAFTKHFASTTRLLAMHRAREEYQVDVNRKLFDLQTP